MSFFLSFNPNSDFLQFASAVYRYNIFRYKENVVELIFPNSRVTFQSRQSNIEAANLFSNSTLISAIEPGSP